MLQANFEISPVTLEIGDYVLSPEICFERKSLSDLTGSLSSGRLFNQATAMLRSYKMPALLIEVSTCHCVAATAIHSCRTVLGDDIVTAQFDMEKSMSLWNGLPVSPDVAVNHVASKLVILTLHFPSLRLFWCKDPDATVSLVTALKVLLAACWFMLRVLPKPIAE